MAETCFEKCEGEQQGGDEVTQYEDDVKSGCVVGKGHLHHQKCKVCNGRQTANGKRQTANGKRQTANGKWQTANGKRQTANGKRQMNCDFIA